MKKKIFVGFLVITMIAGLIAGCGNGESSKKGETDKKTEAEIDGSKPFAGQSITWVAQGWEDKTEDIIQGFEELTGAVVNTEWYSFNDLFEVIEVKVGGGSSDFDVISVDGPMVSAYANRGYIVPVDDYFTEEEVKQYVESAVEAGTYNDEFYAPPMNTSSQLLWYNTALLEEAGVEVPDSSTEDRLTWEQVEEMAEATLAVIDPDGSKGYGGLMFQQISRTYQMNALPNSLGEKNIGDDGFTVDGVINTAGWVKACTWYQDLFENGTALRGLTADQVTETFVAGNIVFLVGGTWTELDFITNGLEDYGYAAMPAFEGYEDSVATPTGSWHFGITSNSENKELAAEFIKYITLYEGNDMWLEVENPVPTTKRVIEDTLADENADEIMKIAAYEAEHTAVPRALTPGYTEYDSVIANMWEDIRNGADVKTSLDNAVSQINTAFEKYKD